MPADGLLDPDWRAECAAAAPFPVLERAPGASAPLPPRPEERPEWRTLERTVVLELLLPGPSGGPQPSQAETEQTLELRFYGAGKAAGQLLATAALPLRLPLSIDANCATHRVALFGNDTAGDTPRPLGTLDGAILLNGYKNYNIRLAIRLFHLIANNYEKFLDVIIYL